MSIVSKYQTKNIHKNLLLWSSLYPNLRNKVLAVLMKGKIFTENKYFTLVKLVEKSSDF
jgi:hypothetical protein